MMMVMTADGDARIVAEGGSACYVHIVICRHDVMFFGVRNNNNNRRLATLAKHTSDHGRQTNSSTKEKGEQV